MGAICPKHLIIKEKRVVTSLKIKGNVTQTLGSFLKKDALNKTKEISLKKNLLKRKRAKTKIKQKNVSPIR